MLRVAVPYGELASRQLRQLAAGGRADLAITAQALQLRLGRLVLAEQHQYLRHGQAVRLVRRGFVCCRQRWWCRRYCPDVRRLSHHNLPIALRRPSSPSLRLKPNTPLPPFA